jgi:glycosyltransferase involved in cell wall biosynthesis
MSQENYPLVSCLCVTHNKPELLKRSIECFLTQTYPNKELVLTYMADNTETKTFVETLSDPRIICHELPASSVQTLGEKRNLSIEKSNGFYFCTWDDDDWHSNKRIEQQVADLQQKNHACSVLSHLIIYDQQTQGGFLSASRTWEQTLLCKKSLINFDTVRYAHIDRGEDTVLISDLRARNLVSMLFDPGLYVYIYHGNNTWYRRHWERNVMNRSEPLPTERSALIKSIVEGGYSPKKASELMDVFRN